jgi:hypothetical protein
MKSKQFMRAKLETRTNADCSEAVVKNNRYHYRLRFTEPIGFDWLEAQIDGVNAETNMALELYKVRPSGVNDFEIEVRELRRRKNIDNSQHSLTNFEQS